jgi:C1A family cysteine protease
MKEKLKKTIKKNVIKTLGFVILFAVITFIVIIPQINSAKGSLLSRKFFANEKTKLRPTYERSGEKYKSTKVKELSPQKKEEIAKVQSQIAAKHLHFTVGHTGVSHMDVSSICGSSRILQKGYFSINNLFTGKTDRPRERLGDPTVTYFNLLKYDSYNLPWIKNQGQHGTCWTFATAAAYESSFNIVNHIGIDLSEQYILNCSNGCATKNCDSGGFAPIALQNMLKAGNNLYDERTEPYKGVKGPCNGSNLNKDFFYLEGFKMVPTSGDVSSSGVLPIPPVQKIKEYLVTYGAVACCIFATKAFEHYNGGIFDEESNDSINHAVTIIGWDDGKQAWIVRNSWGNEWGTNCDNEEAGYAWVKYGSNNIGSGACVAIAKPTGYVHVFCQAGYVTKFDISFNTPRGEFKDSKKLSLGFSYQWNVPEDATNVTVEADCEGCVKGKIFSKTYPTAPQECFKTFGTIFKREWNNNCEEGKTEFK